jgi:N6-L-threonylcarbamoyladenine synthase
LIILGVESSCDETAAAVIDGEQVLSNVVSTQLIHQQWGGVVPELASREHIRIIQPVVQAALDEAGVTLADIEAVAVTRGPGLLGSLLVGFHFCKGLALANDIPFLGINHMEGHIFANFTDERAPDIPTLVLVISGGHTQLVLMEENRRFKIIGETLDDAAGEAFDKVSKLLGMGYPGGPLISKKSAAGKVDFVDFPRALTGREGFDFSFSGLKTSVLHYLREHDENFISLKMADICASFQEAIVDVLERQTLKAAKIHKAKCLVLAGGVAANNRLRERLTSACQKSGMELKLPQKDYCTDNAVMIARAAHGRLLRGERSTLDLDATPRLRLDQN